MRTVDARAFTTFADAEKADREEYRAMTPAERVELIAQLRALRHGPDDATAPGLERVLGIIELSGS